MEAGILEDGDVAGRQRRHRLFGTLAAAIVDEADRAAEQLGIRPGQRAPATCPGGARPWAGRNGRAGGRSRPCRQARVTVGRVARKPRVVADLALLHRHVEVDAHERALAVDVAEIVEGRQACESRSRLALLDPDRIAEGDRAAAEDAAADAAPPVGLSAPRAALPPLRPCARRVRSRHGPRGGPRRSRSRRRRGAAAGRARPADWRGARSREPRGRARRRPPPRLPASSTVIWRFGSLPGRTTPR